MNAIDYARQGREEGIWSIIMGANAPSWTASNLNKKPCMRTTRLHMLYEKDNMKLVRWTKQSLHTTALTEYVKGSCLYWEKKVFVQR